jgi:hypothetical protein
MKKNPFQIIEKAKKKEIKKLLKKQKASGVKLEKSDVSLTDAMKEAS